MCTLLLLNPDRLEVGGSWDEEWIAEDEDEAPTRACASERMAAKSPRIPKPYLLEIEVSLRKQT